MVGISKFQKLGYKQTDLRSTDAGITHVPHTAISITVLLEDTTSKKHMDHISATLMKLAQAQIPRNVSRAKIATQTFHVWYINGIKQNFSIRSMSSKVTKNK